jgi:hypothetical protein
MHGKARAPRIATRQEAVLITSDLVETNVIIVDVSGTGFRIEAGETFYIGENILIAEEVVIRLPRQGDVRAQIRWALGCEAGGVFLEQPGIE